jgi:integrase
MIIESQPKARAARGSGRLYKRGDSGYWWIQFYDGSGKQTRESTKTEDEKKAAKLLRKRLGQVEAGVHRSTANLRYEDVRAAYYADYATQRRRSLRRDREGNPRLDKVARLDAFFGGYRVSKIDPDVLRDFIADQQAKGLADSTINRSLSALRRMLNLARREGKLSQLPAFPMLREPHAREGFFEEGEYRRLSRELPDYLTLPLALGYYTAMRAGEVFAVEWDQVDFLRDTIRLRADQTKSGEGRTIPIVPQLRALLEEQRSRRQPGCPFVCFKLDRKGHAVKIESFRKAWYSACVRTGLGRMEPAVDRATGKPLFAPPRGKRSKPKVKMVYRGMIFHDLRRTGVRNLVRAGVPQSVAMDISGHKTRSVFDRYDIGSEQDIRDAAEKLARYHEAQANGAVSGPFSQQVPLDGALVN